MIKIENVRDLPAQIRGGYFTIGNFDGVHLGHAHLLRAAHAARPGAPLAVMTLEPHPREFFRPDDPPFLHFEVRRGMASADPTEFLP